MPTRKRKYEEDDRQTIPNILQGEVARLDPKFLVNLDPSFCSNNGTVHLICKLGEFRHGSLFLFSFFFLSFLVLAPSAVYDLNTQIFIREK